MVAPNGVIYQGINGDDNATGAHFCGYNKNTFGVCVMGSYTRATPSDDALNSLGKVLGWKAKKEDIDPFGEGFKDGVGTISFITGHRTAGCSVCPGDRLNSLLRDIRRMADACGGSGGCSDTKNLTGTIDSGTYEASETITANGNIPSGNRVVLSAGNTVKLTTGFTARQGSTLTVKIQGCSKALLASNKATSIQADNSRLAIEENSSTLPDVFQLFPNPTSDILNISYELSEKDFVTLQIWNLAGNKITTVIDKKMQSPDLYTVVWDGSTVPEGLYLCTLKLKGGLTVSEKFIIQR